MTTIDRPTREALHAGLVLDLSGLSGAWTLLDQDRADEARRLRERFEQDWRAGDQPRIEDVLKVAEPGDRFGRAPRRERHRPVLGTNMM